MKKLAVFMLAFAVMLGMGFSVEAAGHLDDGEYVGYSEADDNGYVQAVVNIEDHEITSVELTEYTDLYLAKGEDYPWDEWHQAMDELPGMFREVDGPEVDIISGATGTCEKAMEAVNQALMRSMGASSFDGTFMASSDASDRGNVGVAWVTVEDGNIVEVDLKETDGEGDFKGDEYDWDEFHEAKEELPERFIDANSPEVDIYSGATGSSNMWMQAVERALEKAGL